MNLPLQFKRISEISIARDENGVPHVFADNSEDLYHGLGFCHALDRGLQLLMMRILGQGRLSEILDSSENSLEIDRFFRRMNWSGNIVQEEEQLTPAEKSILQAYCEGINIRFSTGYPLEFKLFKYKPAPWTIADILLLGRMTGYLTLAQSQGEMERFILQLVQAGIRREMLEELFPGGILEGLDEPLIRKTRFTSRIVPEGLKWGSLVPKMMASNSWVISPELSKSNHALFANDPHLEVNRLPNVWYEVVLQTPERYMMGSSMPGLPAILLGRNNDLAWGATYTFMDSIDSWIEQCKDGKFLRDGKWEPFSVRKETIKRKGKPSAEFTFYENHHGALEGDPFEDGYYLSTRWSSTLSGASSLKAFLGMMDAREVDRGMELMGRLEYSFNWIFADRSGGIGHQMSGLMPKRRAGVSGLVPLPGWESRNDWQGTVQPEDLPRSKNPKEGYIITANHNVNHLGKAHPINVCMGSYRADRVRELLSEKKKFEARDFCKMQYDLLSTHARAFMPLILPLLPATANGQNIKILKSWNLRYDVDSRGAFLFEQIYQKLLSSVFGTAMGYEVDHFLQRETGIYSDFYANFDRILLLEKSAWFGDRSREQIYREAIGKALDQPARRWGDVQKMKMKHLLFGDKLPVALGFDRGPMEVPGGRGTLSQGQLYRSGGRDTSFLPSVRIVIDLGRSDMRSNLAGGPSDRRLSKWYCSDLENWKTGKYKTIKPGKIG